MSWVNSKQNKKNLMVLKQNNYISLLWSSINQYLSSLANNSKLRNEKQETSGAKKEEEEEEEERNWKYCTKRGTNVEHNALSLLLKIRV
ncbi:hypothetical protein Scep_013623 [Stephania cephalantha]|uniref:Uncharacterized protein n=1 Tax=Stephania cephalantha TaxID=152367 RepID=A0AAP0PAU5_9MAGN